MAIYTINLSSGTGAVTSLDTLYIRKDSTFNYDFAYDTYANAERGYLYAISKITVPTNTSPVKVFAGYYDASSNLRINEEGYILLRNASYPSLPFVTTDGTWTASWTNICPTATISKNSGIGGTSEIYFNSADNKWYLDYPFSTPFDSSHPLTPPTRTQYAFLGCYSANNTTSTKYINEDGTPTAAFLALTPSADITIYAQWKQVSYKVTLSHSSGSPTTTVFYAKIGVTGTDRFYSDDLCTSGLVIHAITPPSRELYSWKGAFSTSTQSAANTYIDSSGEFQTLLYNLSITANKTISYANYWTQISYKFTLSGSGWTFSPKAYYTHKTNGLVYADWFCETDALDYVAIPVRDGYRFLGYKVSTTEVVGYTGLISDTLKNYKAAKTLTVQGRAKTRTITFNDNGGTGGPVKLYTDATDRIYVTTDSKTVTSIDIPTKSGYVFKGYFYSSTEVCDENGDLTYVAFSSDQTVTARWERGNSTISVLRGSGTGGTSVFYFRGSDEKFYADSSYTTEITSVTLPTLDLHTTSGLYDYNGNQRVDSSGTILSSFIPVGDLYALTARYVRSCYRLTLNHDGGSSSTSSIYQSASTAAWYSESSLTTAITTVPIPTKSGYVFGGYSYYDTPVVNSSGAILSAAVRNADYTATATWIPIVYKTKPTAISGLVYNGSSRVGVNYDQSLSYTGTILETNAGSYTATFSLPSDTSSAVYRWSDGTTGNVTVQWSISRLSVTDSSVTFDEIPNQMYAGSPICPTVTMRFGGDAKTLNVDYTVTYSNNTNVGTAFAKVSGIANFSGTKSLSFQIITPPVGIVYIPKPNAVSGKVYNTYSQYGTDYDSRLTTSGTLYATNAGTYTAYFTLPNDTSTINYRWTDSDTSRTATVNWSIAPRPVSDSSVTFGSIPDQTYNGTPKTPPVSMSYAGSQRTQGTDYTVTYSNNTEIGTATATVSGTGNFGGTKALTFSIVSPGYKTVTFDACGGTASESSRTVMYGQQIGTLPTASRSGYTFDGWHTSIYGGTRVYETDVVTEDATYYAHWTAIQYTISYELNGGTNSPNNPSSYTTEEAIYLNQPKRDGYAFDGWSPDNGVIPIGSTGNKTFTASWTTTATYTVTFNAQGGYCPESTRAVIQGRSVGTLPTATKDGYTFNGWWTSATGGTQISDSYVPTNNVTIHVHWTPLTYTLTFNANGGSVSPSSKTVTMGSQIGTLPTPTMAGRTFVEWRINGNGITSTTVWDIASNTTAVAKWNGDFGDVVDYFGLGNANLIPESSDSGESKPHVVAYNAQSETPATDDGPSWRNPTVSYRVVGAMTLNVTLGSAFKAKPDFSKPTQTGYMITSVTISTAIGKPPTVTVKSVANEGFTLRQSGSSIYYNATPTPAIKTYVVSIPVSPRHRPQNLLSAISGGGQLQQLTLTATCDPIVLAEDNMPCASDVCHGRIEVSAVTAAYNNEVAPNAVNNFTSTGATVQMSGVGYKTWAINARKELS